MALALLIAVGASTSAHAEQADPVAREILLHPRFTKRCRALDMARVPSAWVDFQAQITRWIGTCVTSRSSNIRREVALVQASQTLAPLWRALVKGRPARIVPNYTWGSFRVERIEFSSPQAKAATVTHSPQPPDATPGGVPRPPTDHTLNGHTPPPQPDQQPASQPVPPGIRPPASVPDIDIRVPDESDELLLDARRLVDNLRARGKDADADKLDIKIKAAKAALLSLVGLVGAYYIGTKIRGGKLLIMWGWNAIGDGFTRRVARLERLLPEVEQTLRDVVSTARPHVPAAGSGLDWKVLDQLVDGTVQAQLDDAACGPACVQIALRDRGIDIAQDELIRRARKSIQSDIATRRIRTSTLSRLLRDLDPAGGWQLGQPLNDEFLRGKSARVIIEELGQKGSWIAQVGTHFVVVDGFDSEGNLRIRDPWYEPGMARGIRAGSHYRVSLRAFVDHWFAYAVYR